LQFLFNSTPLQRRIAAILSILHGGFGSAFASLAVSISDCSNVKRFRTGLKNLQALPIYCDGTQSGRFPAT
jgi:hypothetical protein